MQFVCMSPTFVSAYLLGTTHFLQFLCFFYFFFFFGCSLLQDSPQIVNLHQRFYDFLTLDAVLAQPRLEPAVSGLQNHGTDHLQPPREAFLKFYRNKNYLFYFGLVIFAASSKFQMSYSGFSCGLFESFLQVIMCSLAHLIILNDLMTMTILA